MCASGCKQTNPRSAELDFGVIKVVMYLHALWRWGNMPEQYDLAREILSGIGRLGDTVKKERTRFSAFADLSLLRPSPHAHRCLPCVSHPSQPALASRAVFRRHPKHLSPPACCTDLCQLRNALSRVVLVLVIAPSTEAATPSRGPYCLEINSPTMDTVSHCICASVRAHHRALRDGAGPTRAVSGGPGRRGGRRGAARAERRRAAPHGSCG